jgi:hypothetical protein
MHPDTSNERYLTAGRGGCREDVVIRYDKDSETVPTSGSAQLSGGGGGGGGGESEPTRWKIAVV